MIFIMMMTVVMATMMTKTKSKMGLTWAMKTLLRMLKFQMIFH